MKRAARMLGTLAVGSVLAIALPSTASADWTATTDPGGAARSATMTMPAGNQPTATVTPPLSSTVAVAWTASSGGAPVAGYEVRSYDAVTGVPRAVGASCAGIVAGTSCGENSVPTGSWRYSVIPRQQAWAGAESPLSDPVVVDTTPPVVASSVISKTVPYEPGYVRQGGTYYVYANATDDIGVGSVTADVSAVTAGQTAVALTAGSYSIGGITYNYRSASLTAGNPLAAGAKTYTVSATDVVGNAAAPAPFSVTVDNTSPSASDIQTSNAGTAGRPELGDTIIYTFSEPIDPQSILAGWTGTSTDVVVGIENNLLGDRVTIRDAANSATVPFGTVSLVGTNYVTANRDFGATGTPSTMVISGATITVTLGTASGAVATQILPNPMVWTPSASATDRAGNACLTTPAIESGILDIDF